MDKMASQAALVLAAASVAAGELTLDGVKCMQMTCKLNEYCSSVTSRCEPCNDVCNRTNRNYDGDLCVKECQGYIHELRFLGRDEGGSSAGDIKAVQQQARVALIISSVALAVLLLLLLLRCVSFLRTHRSYFTWKYIQKVLQPSKNRVKAYPGDLTHHNPHAEMGKLPKHELKLEIRNPEPPKRAHQQQPLNVRDLDNRTSHTEKSVGATTPKTISTNISNRHPAEDTTLDYSYDNMGMNVTPPPAAQPSASHNF